MRSVVMLWVAVLIAGFAAIVWGAWLIHMALGLIVLGGGLVVTAFYALAE